MFWPCLVPDFRNFVDNFIAAGDAALHEDLPEEAWQLDHKHVFSLFVVETLYHKKNIQYYMMHPGITVLRIFGQSSRCAPQKQDQANHRFLVVDPGKSSILQAHPTFVTKAKICRRTSVPFKSCVVKSYLGCSFAAVNVVVFLADGHDGAWLRRRRSVLWVPHIRWGYWMCNGSGLVFEIDLHPLFRILGRETRFELHSYIPHHSNKWRFSMLRFQCFVLFFDCMRWASKRHTSPQEKLQVRPLHSEREVPRLYPRILTQLCPRTLSRLCPRTCTLSSPPHPTPPFCLKYP